MLRNRLLIPAWVGGLTLVACVARRRARHRRTSSRSRSARSRSRASRGRSSSVCAPAGARPSRGVAGRDAAHGARATRASTAGCSCTSVSSCSRSALDHDRRATRPSARCSSRPGQSATVRGFTVTYLRSRRSRRRRRRRRSRPTFAIRRGSSNLGTSTRPRSRRTRTSPTASARRAIHTDPWHDVYLTLVSAPHDGGARGRDDVGRAGRHDRDVALDRRR